MTVVLEFAKKIICEIETSFSNIYVILFSCLQTSKLLIAGFHQ